MNYLILNVSFNATLEEIKAAYRALAMKYHPDRNPNDKVAEDKFKEIQTAYDVLEERKLLFTAKLGGLRSQKTKTTGEPTNDREES